MQGATRCLAKDSGLVTGTSTDMRRVCYKGLMKIHFYLCPAARFENGPIQPFRRSGRLSCFRYTKMYIRILCSINWAVRYDSGEKPSIKEAVDWISSVPPQDDKRTATNSPQCLLCCHCAVCNAPGKCAATKFEIPSLTACPSTRLGSHEHPSAFL